jgi:hypothetical protein
LSIKWQINISWTKSSYSNPRSQGKQKPNHFVQRLKSLMDRPTGGLCFDDVSHASMDLKCAAKFALPTFSRPISIEN